MDSYKWINKDESVNYDLLVKSWNGTFQLLEQLSSSGEICYIILKNARKRSSCYTKHYIDHYLFQYLVYKLELVFYFSGWGKLVNRQKTYVRKQDFQIYNSSSYEDQYGRSKKRK